LTDRIVRAVVNPTFSDIELDVGARNCRCDWVGFRHALLNDNVEDHDPEENSDRAIFVVSVHPTLLSVVARNTTVAGTVGESIPGGEEVARNGMGAAPTPRGSTIGDDQETSHGRSATL
jgi:hypothetical protein